MSALRSVSASAILLAVGVSSYPLRACLPLLVRGIFADFFWAAAFACALAAFTKSARFSLVGFLVAELLEVAQLHPSFPGTFDVADLLAIAIGWAVGLGLERVSRLRPVAASC